MLDPTSPTAGFRQTLIHDAESLTFGVEVADRLLGRLETGNFVALHGSHACHVLSELLCVRSQLPIREGGLGSPVVFVDGGNRFDPYLVAENARLLGLDPDEALRNVWVSRAFTNYQLTALVTERLPEALSRVKPKLVVVSDPAALYCDSDIGLLEAKRTFNRVARSLWTLAKERSLLLVATSFQSSNWRKRLLEQYLIGRADVAARVEEDAPRVRLTLERHPSKPAVSAELLFDGPRSQYLLEEFMEA